MPNTPSLGDLLRNKIAADKAEEARLAQEKSDAALAEKNRINTVLTSFFDGAKKQFSDLIRANRPITAIRVGRGTNTEIASLLSIHSDQSVVRSSHQYYSFWRDFADWAADNGLLATWTYEHDGVGIESWYVLSVQPAAT